MAEQYPDLHNRPVKETICLFDVDGTLTPARQRVSPEMLKLLSQLRHKCAIGFVGRPLSISLFRVRQPEPQKQCPIDNLFKKVYGWRNLISSLLGLGARRPDRSHDDYL
jgi:hypothetical protein